LKVADDARPGVEVAETTAKWLLCCGFWWTGKAMGQVYQCWWRIRRETNVFFSCSNITHFMFCVNLWLIHWLSLIELQLVGSSLFHRHLMWMLWHQCGNFIARGE
jgi:hypothetical protein